MDVMSVAAHKLQSSTLKWETHPDFCREQGVLLAGDGAKREVEIGVLLGKRTVGGVPTVAADEGNTGDGELVVADPGTGAGAKAGDYLITITGGAFDVTAAAHADNAVNTGVATVHTTEFAVGAVEGIYQAICLEPGSDLGTFEVFDPFGVSIGTATVGVLFDGVIKFTIGDGSQDFIAGEGFNFTVEAIVPANGLGTFSVVDPDGIAVASGTVGSAYDGVIKFTLGDGDADFVVADVITVTVPAGDDKMVAWSPSAIDGTDAIYGVTLVKATAADGTDGRVLFLRRGPAIIALNGIVWPSGTTDNQKAAALAALEALNILARAS